MESQPAPALIENLVDQHRRRLSSLNPQHRGIYNPYDQGIVLPSFGRFDRRRFLLLLGGATAAGALVLGSHIQAPVAEAQSSSWIWGKRPWTSWYWGSEVGEDGQPHISEALVEYTKYANGDDRARAWHLENITGRLNLNEPGVGSCHGLSNAAIFTEAPDTTNFIKVGVLISHFNGAVAIPIPEFADFVRLLRAGQTLSVDAPEKPGRWFRGCYGISPDNLRVAVTNYGAERAEPYTIPISRVKMAWVILSPDDPRSQDPILRAPTAFWWNSFNNPDNPDHRQLVRAIAYS